MGGWGLGKGNNGFLFFEFVGFQYDECEVADREI